MKHLFVPYELAIILKEKGFDEPCFGWWHVVNTPELKDIYDVDYFLVIKDNWNSECQVIPAPLYQQAFDWIFKKLDFMYPYMSIEMFSDGSGMWYHPADDGKDNKLEIDFDNINEAIEEALKLI